MNRKYSKETSLVLTDKIRGDLGLLKRYESVSQSTPTEEHMPGTRPAVCRVGICITAAHVPFGAPDDSDDLLSDRTIFSFL